MLHLVDAAPTLESARGKARDALDSGAGLRRFQEAIELQGGDPRVCDDTSLLPRAKETIELKAAADGRVTSIGCRAVGHAGMLLGAGRETVESAIDPAVGIVLHKKVGDLVVHGEPLLTLHVNDRSRLEAATALLRTAVKLGPEAPPAAPLVREIVA
jgi:thymidine phosphorylase